MRNLLENPAWYTAYTPYQPEISQGRLEALLNFQTLISDLSGLPIANASLLDEATAAAEAMTFCKRLSKNKTSHRFFASSHCHPQTLDVLRTRAEPLGIEVVVADEREVSDVSAFFGALLQYPASNGDVFDYRELVERFHAANALVAVAADLLALTLLTPPGEFGADVAIGSAQRFGVPLGFGGPHAAYFATRDAFKRDMPGRLVGVSVDRHGKPALRLAMQTREQHIRREKATSNICTAQVLLANIASMYAVYHGPKGLSQIARRIHQLTAILAQGLSDLGLKVEQEQFFDTLTLNTGDNTAALHAKAHAQRINLRVVDNQRLGLSLDETSSQSDVTALWALLAADGQTLPDFDALAASVTGTLPAALLRQSPILSHPVFNRYHSETELMRYLRKLADKDLALDRTMIPLGSCTMKLNAASEMIPVTWAEFGALHPFAPAEQSAGYLELTSDLEAMLCAATGYDAISLQPNAGSQGEYAGLLAITLRSFLRSSRTPIVFVPVYIGYERVLEGRTYLGELRGASKKKESIFDIFKVIGALKQKFGQVAVNFGEPIKLAEFLDQEQPDWRKQELAPLYRPDWLNATTNRLGEKVARHLNEAAAINPVNLVALALLSTSKLALDDRAMARVLDLYLALLRRVPYSPHTTLPEGDGQALIEHVKAMDLLSEQSDALGKILYLDEQNAVLMTYYRNNVLHIFALPALLASFFQSTSRMSREQILRYTHALYPYLQ